MSAEEIDGLRHELAECQRCNDRLRAEKEELVRILKVLIEPPRGGPSGIVIEEALAILAKTAKEEK